MSGYKPPTKEEFSRDEASIAGYYDALGSKPHRVKSAGDSWLKGYPDEYEKGWVEGRIAYEYVYKEVVK